MTVEIILAVEIIPAVEILSKSTARSTVTHAFFSDGLFVLLQLIICCNLFSTRANAWKNCK